MSPAAWAITYDRFNQFDFVTPVFFSPFTLLLPLPTNSVIVDISSIWKPFQNPVMLVNYLKIVLISTYTCMYHQVWMALAVSMTITIALSLIDRFYNRKANNTAPIKGLDLHWLFVFGLLVSKSNDQYSLLVFSVLII